MVLTIRMFQGQRCADTGWEQNITYRNLAWGTEQKHPSLLELGDSGKGAGECLELVAYRHCWKMNLVQRELSQSQAVMDSWDLFVALDEIIH